MITLRKSKSRTRLAREWDQIARLRHDQVSSGRDHSANHVLAPAILSELVKVNTLIDVGCGTGWFTAKAAKFASATVGVDPSKRSIEVALDVHSTPGITYRSASIEDYSLEGEKFDAAVSNMSASSAADIFSFMSATRAVLRKNSFFIFTVPHPFFFPMYWGYASHPKFLYHKSWAVEDKFKIQAEVTNMPTTHFHHPLEVYFSALGKGGFQVEKLSELIGRGFDLPRFILLKARAI